MRAPDGRPFVRDGIGEQLRSSRKTIDVVDRKLNRQPRIPESTVSSVYGTTRVNPGAASEFIGGATSNVQWTDVGHSMEDAGGVAPALTWDSGDYLRVVDEGFYVLTLRGRFWWDIDGTEPTWVTGDFRGESNADAATQGWQPYVKSTRREIEVCHSFGGPWLLAAGDALSLSLQWQGSQSIQIGVGLPRLDVTRVG